MTHGPAFPGPGLRNGEARDIVRAIYRDRVAGRGWLRYQPPITDTGWFHPGRVLFHGGDSDPVAILRGKGRAWVWSPGGFGMAPGLVRDSGVKG